ncbi:MAG: hypothetical protein H7281_07920 [Bacteriovorax sp.]|nr:hypothetical protein [Bacteriovorax sp.]
MKNKRLVLPRLTFFHSLFFFLLFIGGCATSYQRLGKNGGYSDEKINDRVYKVSFQGNTRTSDDKVHKYFLRRCAEVALEHHFPYFIIIEKDDITKYTTVTAEGSPLTKAKITAVSYSGNTPFVPTEQKSIPKHLIEGKIALFKDGEQPVNAIIVEEVLKYNAD